MTTFKNGLAKHESGFYHYWFRHEVEQYMPPGQDWDSAVLGGKAAQGGAVPGVLLDPLGHPRGHVGGPDPGVRPRDEESHRHFK